jgi:hypothetical protein
MQTSLLKPGLDILALLKGLDFSISEINPKEERYVFELTDAYIISITKRNDQILQVHGPELRSPQTETISKSNLPFS